MLSIPVTNNILNVAQLQENMNETVFNYIDSTQNWHKAYSELNNLVHQVTQYFNNWVEKEGELPKGSTYWTIFMDIVARLIYFYGLAQEYLIEEQGEALKEEILNIYTVAANCMPDVQSEDNQDFLEEIKKSYLQLNTTEHNTLLLNPRTINNCIATFSEFSKNN
ncbi:hypothetical protein [Solibacillus sp. CAU 1738]|uniref:hypothetical protein n=1 Tax=Solibacillus sp. CAU 1738 TaxID=3140363 RepID=UPI00326159FF